MAHVMNYQELKLVMMGDQVYEEIKDGTIYPLVFNGKDFTTKGKPWLVAEHYLTLAECNEEECMDYNWNYRVWDEMPTEEEQKKPWKEDPYKEYT